jgi:hypothetical protein
MNNIRASFRIQAVILFFFLSVLSAEGGVRNSCSSLFPREFMIKFNNDIRLLGSIVNNIEKTLDLVERDNNLFTLSRKQDFDIMDGRYEGQKIKRESDNK